MKKRLAKILDNSPNLDVLYQSQEEYEKAAEYLIENDVVAVVRCKDCKYLTVVNNESVYARCEKTGYIFGSFETDTREHFCSYGERSENGKS